MLLAWLVGIAWAVVLGMVFTYGGGRIGERTSAEERSRADRQCLKQESECRSERRCSARACSAGQVSNHQT
jgi:hypothetical protein